MNHDEFVFWAEDYCRVFGITIEAEYDAVFSWEAFFIAAEWHPQDLAECTLALVSDTLGMAKQAGDARYLGKMAMHLAAIESWMNRGLANRTEVARSEFEEKHGVCGVCNGSGHVVVPHLRGIRRGLWVGVATIKDQPVFYTTAVVCSCSLGKHINAGRVKDGRNRKGTPVMTLEQYEGENPDWRRHMEGRTNARRERTRLTDPRWQEAMDELCKRFKVPAI